jgi:hypothetical protein
LSESLNAAVTKEQAPRWDFDAAVEGPERLRHRGLAIDFFSAAEAQQQLLVGVQPPGFTERGDLRFVLRTEWRRPGRAPSANCDHLLSCPIERQEPGALFRLNRIPRPRRPPVRVLQHAPNIRTEPARVNPSRDGKRHPIWQACIVSRRVACDDDDSPQPPLGPFEQVLESDEELGITAQSPKFSRRTRTEELSDVGCMFHDACAQQRESCGLCFFTHSRRLAMRLLIALLALAFVAGPIFLFLSPKPLAMLALFRIVLILVVLVIGVREPFEPTTSRASTQARSAPRTPQARRQAIDLDPIETEDPIRVALRVQQTAFDAPHRRDRPSETLRNLTPREHTDDLAPGGTLSIRDSRLTGHAGRASELGGRRRCPVGWRSSECASVACGCELERHACRWPAHEDPDPSRIGASPKSARVVKQGRRRT